MSRARSIVALIAVLALPVGAALASRVFIPRPEPPEVREVVRIGEEPADSATPTPSTTGPTTGPSGGQTMAPPPPTTTQLPPPPPVDDDDDDDDDDDNDNG
jgi:hypothetical protein